MEREGTTQQEQRYKLTIQYDGSAYSGWQRQGKYQVNSSSIIDDVKKTCTVQQALEDALSRFVRSMIRSKVNDSNAQNEEDNNICHVQVFGSSRTDAGVHAVCSTAHFDLASHQVRRDMPDGEKVMKALNSYLSKEKVTVTSCTQVSNDYNARNAARKRIYNYKMVIVPDSHVNVRFPLLANRVWFLNLDEFIRKNSSKTQREQLLRNIEFNIDKMKEAANIMCGTHNFSSFCSPGDPQRNNGQINYVRTIDSIQVDHKTSEEGHNDYALSFFMNPLLESLSITIQGPSFLYHQCRYIVHVLVCIATNILSLEDLHIMFETKELPRGKRRMAPPDGLYLVKVVE